MAEISVPPPVAELLALLRGRSAAGDKPLFVGIDGRSGAGKSTIAARLAEHLASAPGPAGAGAGAVTVIEGDGFYAGGSAAAWDRRTAAEQADQVIAWHGQRDVLQGLRTRGSAEWHPFDWEAEDWDTDHVPLAPAPVVAQVARVVVLEGAYSCRPELHDLLDLRVLIEVPREVRLRRLLEREGELFQADWAARWAAAEDHYFSAVMPRGRFDLVVGAPSW